MALHERLLLPEAEAAMAIATDDVHLFQRLSHEEPEKVITPPLASLDAEWGRVGLQGHPGKAVDLAKSAKVLGVELRSGIKLQARGSKMWSLFEASLDLLTLGKASPGEVAVFNGHLQWKNLMNRPLYSALHHVYGFIHLHPESSMRPVPDQVLSELLLNVSLFAFWSADLRRPWWPCLPATDASPSYGYGLSLAKCHPSLTRAIAAATSESVSVIRLSQDDIYVDEVPRKGPVFRIPQTFGDFKTIFSIKPREISHSGAMELQAVKIAILRLTRSSRMHSHRGVLLVDAQAVGYALRKGRTSAGTLRRGVCAVSAVSLAAILMISYPYLPSESNPADYPSRGTVRRRAFLKPHKASPRCSLELMERAYRRAARRWKDCENL